MHRVPRSNRAINVANALGLTPLHPSAANPQTSRVMRFMVAPNMLGLPALSLPVGCVPEEAEGSTSARSNAGGGGGRGAVQLLPVGLQLMGRPLCEATLLRVAAVLEVGGERGGTAGRQVSGHHRSFEPTGLWGCGDVELCRRGPAWWWVRHLVE